jgi:hypothetical protein
MKYIKQYEGKKPKKYNLLKTDPRPNKKFWTNLPSEEYIYIAEHMQDDYYKKHYEVVDDKLIKLEKPYYFPLSKRIFNKQIIYTSDSINDVLEHLDSLINSIKFNI